MKKNPHSRYRLTPSKALILPFSRGGPVIATSRENNFFMKKTIIPAFAFAIIVGLVACSDTKDRYIDLRTGKTVELVEDEKTGLMVDATTNEPVYLYVDTKNNDTIYGKTGEVINGHLIVTDNNEYVYEKDFQSYEVKGEDYKVEVEKDGDIKIKDGDSKLKIDGETGEKKVKNDD